MEEQNNNRVNVERTLQLIDTGATTIASACPFCMTMLGDGLEAKDREDIRHTRLDQERTRSSPAACTSVRPGARVYGTTPRCGKARTIGYPLHRRDGASLLSRFLPLH
jgi:hypothetical protein